LENILKRIHHSRFAGGLYRRLPFLKKTIDRAHMVYVGSGELMTNRCYWEVFRALHYCRPDYRLFPRYHARRLRLPIDDGGTIHINPGKIEFAVAPISRSGEETDAVQPGNWDLRREKLDDTKISTPRREHSDPGGELRVAVDRNGGFLLENGKEKLALARMQAVETVPAIVTRRHYDWAKFRKEVFDYSQEQPKGTYQTTVHPDLQVFPSHRGEDRWQLIADNLPLAKGTVLDIGANWGYFCHRLEDLGFDCCAVENNYRWHYFLKKLRDFESKQFQIVSGSVFDIKSKEYDIVLALSVFHHFLRSKPLHDKLVKLLGEFKMKAMFFEPHQTGHGFPNAFIDYNEDDFAKFVIAHSCLKDYRLLGRTARGRNLYLLSA